MVQVLNSSKRGGNGCNKMGNKAYGHDTKTLEQSEARPYAQAAWQIEEAEILVGISTET